MLLHWEVDEGDVTMNDNPAMAPASLLSRAKHEAKEIGLVTLYFLLCFSVVLMLKKLLLAMTSKFCALHSRRFRARHRQGRGRPRQDTSGARFDATHPLGVAALYKTLVYTAATFIVLFLER